MKQLIISLLFITFSFAQSNEKINIINNENYLAANQWEMWFTNSGDISPIGGLWPGGLNAFQHIDGSSVLIWGGMINGQVHVTKKRNLLPGKILDDGTRDNSNKEKYRIYKIKKGWETLPFGSERDEYEKDYNEWPVEDGAPWIDIDGDGIFTRGIDSPDDFADELIWFVYNEIDSSTMQSNIPLISLEVQVTAYAFQRGTLKDAVFKKYKIINKGSGVINEMYLGLQTGINIDVGLENYLGCDSALNLQYGYDKDNSSISYDIPPAGGQVLLQGPIIKTNDFDSAYYNRSWKKSYRNINMTSFTTAAISYDPVLYPSNVSFDEGWYNYLKGFYRNGADIIDVANGKLTKFFFSGDPVQKNGWYCDLGFPAGIKRNSTEAGTFMMSTGPFTLAPYDTQEVVIATIAAQGTDNLNSVTELKRKARIIQKAYNLNFQLTASPPKPKVTANPQEDKITLWWDTNAESYEEEDPLILEQNLPDTSYTFEGYIVRQHRDSSDREGKIIAIYDRKNEVSVIEDYVIVNGVSVKLPVIFGNNEGLRRYITIEKDAFTNNKLYNGNPYYYSVTAYAYSKESSPSYLESEKKIIEVIPGREKIDYSSAYNYEDNVYAQLTSGQSDGRVWFRVIDPKSLTGDRYAVTFIERNDSAKYNLINETRGDTLIKNSGDYGSDSFHQKVMEGFIFQIIDNGRDSIKRNNPGENSAVKSITMDGIDLIGNKIEAVSNGIDKKQGINWKDNIGYDDYEIRFTESRERILYHGLQSIKRAIERRPERKRKSSV